MVTGVSQAQQNQHLQLAMACAAMGMWSYDPNDDIVVADERMRQIFNSPTDEGSVDYWLDLIHPDDKARVAIHFAGAIAGKHPYELEYRVVHPDGVRWVRSKGEMITEDSKPQQMFGIVEDITGRKLTEEALILSQERVRLAQQAGNIATFDWDFTNGRVVWTPGSTWIYGRPPEQVDHIDKLYPFIHEQDQAAVSETIQPALKGAGEFHSEFRVCWPDGSVHFIVGRGLGVLSHDGKPARMVGVNFDVTERKHAEAAVLQTERLAAVGKLASTIAHEINNPIDAVMNILYIAQTGEAPAEIRSLLEMAERELRRAAAITAQTLRFHKQTTHPQPVTCSELFKEVLAIYQSRLVMASVQVELRKRAQRSILCFEGEIRQVLSNLVGNALDAMSEAEGRLLVRSRHGTNWKIGVKGLALTIADTGPGISSPALSKIYDAFFSTKGTNGTGLGLWVSKGIVDRHNGQLWVRSSQNGSHRGTVFVLFLPFEAAGRS